MQRMLKKIYVKKNLRKAVIYKNKLRPATRGNSQAIVSAEFKKINKLVLQVCNQHQMSSSTPTINVRNMYQHKNWASDKYLA